MSLLELWGALTKASHTLGTVDRKVLRLHHGSSEGCDWTGRGDSVLRDCKRLCEHRGALAETLDSAFEAESEKDERRGVRDGAMNGVLKFSDNPVDISETLGLGACGLGFAGMVL